MQFCSLLSDKDAQYLIWKSSQILNGVVSSQDLGRTFKAFYLHSKHLSLWSAYLVKVHGIIVIKRKILKTHRSGLDFLTTNDQ